MCVCLCVCVLGASVSRTAANRACLAGAAQRRLAEVLLREEMNAKRSGGRQGRPFFLATGAAAAAAAEADAAGAMGADGAAPLHAPEPTEHHV